MADQKPQPPEPEKKPHESLGHKLKEKLKEVADDAGNSLGEAFDSR